MIKSWKKLFYGSCDQKRDIFFLSQAKYPYILQAAKVKLLHILILPGTINNPCKFQTKIPNISENIHICSRQIRRTFFFVILFSKANQSKQTNKYIYIYLSILCIWVYLSEILMKIYLVTSKDGIIGLHSLMAGCKWCEITEFTLQLRERQVTTWRQHTQWNALSFTDSEHFWKQNPLGDRTNYFR